MRLLTKMLGSMHDVGRVLRAGTYSMAGLRAALSKEAAFRQEVILFVLLAPLGAWLGRDAVERALLLGSLIMVLIVELLNSAVEATVDRISKKQHKLSGQLVVVTNTTLAPLYGQTLTNSINARLVAVPDGEKYKTLDTVASLYDQFAMLELDRKAVVIALGGGVIGDMIGFAAASYLRGVNAASLACIDQMHKNTWVMSVSPASAVATAARSMRSTATWRSDSVSLAVPRDKVVTCQPLDRKRRAA